MTLEVAAGAAFTTVVTVWTAPPEVVSKTDVEDGVVREILVLVVDVVLGMLDEDEDDDDDDDEEEVVDSVLVEEIDEDKLCK